MHKEREGDGFGRSKAASRGARDMAHPRAVSAKSVSAAAARAILRAQIRRDNLLSMNNSMRPLAKAEPSRIFIVRKRNLVYNKVDIIYREGNSLNELIDILNGGNKEELKAFLNLYSKPIYERALALRNDKEDARACAKRTMAQIVRLAKQGRLLYDIDAQLMRLTDICCNDSAYEKMLLGDMVEEVLAESDEEEEALQSQQAEADETAHGETAHSAATHGFDDVSTHETATPRAAAQAPVMQAPVAHAPIAQAPVMQTPPAKTLPAQTPLDSATTLHGRKDAKPSVVPFGQRVLAPSAPPLDDVVRQASAEAADELEFSGAHISAGRTDGAAVTPIPAVTPTPAVAPTPPAKPARKARQEPEPEPLEAEDDIFDDVEDDTFSPAAQARARREAKKREKEEKRLAAKEKKRQKTDMYDLDEPDDEDVSESDEDELSLFGEEEDKRGRRARAKKPKAPRAGHNDFLDGDDEEDDYSGDEEDTRVSPGMVVLIFVLAVIVVLFVWILIVKLSTMGVINMSDFGFADWFNQNIFKLY